MLELETEFSNITEIAQNGMEYAFYQCPITGNVNFSSLTTVRTRGLYNCFYSTGISSVDFSSLTTIDSQGMYGAFIGNNALSVVRFPSLTTVGDYGLYSTFQECHAVTDVYFNSLTTTSFGGLYCLQRIFTSTGTNVTHTLHFPSNLESTVQGLTGYPNFGGTSGYVTLSFDLAATS